MSEGRIALGQEKEMLFVPLCTARHSRAGETRQYWWPEDISHLARVDYDFGRLRVSRMASIMLGSSVTDLRWMDAVAATGPAMIVAEGLLMYLNADEVRRLLLALRERFPGSQIAFDAFTTFNATRRSSRKACRDLRN